MRISNHCPSVQPPRLRRPSGPVLGAFLLLAAGALHAQPPGPAPPGRGGGGDSVAFEVQSVDPATWVVTARDVESGETFSFRLPPETFRGQRFQADLGDAAAGRKVTVETPPEVPLDRAVIERPIGAQGRAGGSGDFRFDRDEPQGGPGYRRPVDDGSRSASSLGAPGRGDAGPASYEVISVDPRTWEVEARGSDGSTVILEVDPNAFVGFRFRAAVADLQAGQGFQLLATHDRPLANCCVVKGRGIRR